MPNTLKDSEQNAFTGVGTWTHTTTGSGLYTVDAVIMGQPPSGLTLVIKHNGSTVATAPALTPAQQTVHLQAPVICVASDTLSVVVGSAVQNDLNPNTFQVFVTVGHGSNL